MYMYIYIVFTSERLPLQPVSSERNHQVLKLNDTERSKYIWKLKDNKQDFDITWAVLKQSISYTGGSKICNLCLEEKLCILKDKNKQNLLNKNSEIVSTCN